MIPPFMLPYRRKSKAEIALEKKQAMAATIMRALESHMPKKRKRRGSK
jgi:hypothetical protein